MSPHNNTFKFESNFSFDKNDRSSLTINKLKVTHTDAIGVFEDMINARKKGNNDIKNRKNLFSILAKKWLTRTVAN